jgi:hypothetical protein
MKSIILQASWVSGEDRTVVAVIIQEATPEEVAPIVEEVAPIVMSA